MGEWMTFTDEELDKAIKKAKDLKDEMIENLKYFQFAEELKEKESNKDIIDPTPEAEELYETAMNFKEVFKSCKEILDKYSKYLQGAIAQGISVEGKAKVQERSGGKTFDEELFSKNYPDLLKKYSSVTQSISGSFRLKQNKDWAIDISTLDSEQVDLISSFQENLARVDYSKEPEFSLHSEYLGVLEIKKYAEWNSEIAEVKLRVLTGLCEGIKDICTWKRSVKEKIVIDKKTIQAQHLKEYEACLVDRAPTQAILIAPNIA
jgi:hypothetical protein